MQLLFRIKCYTEHMTTSQILNDLKALNDRIATLPMRRAELINQARQEGHTWRTIAETLNMTEHGAIKASNPAARRGRPRID